MIALTLLATCSEEGLPPPAPSPVIATYIPGRQKSILVEVSMEIFSGPSRLNSRSRYQVLVEGSIETQLASDTRRSHFLQSIVCFNEGANLDRFFD